MKIVRDKEEEVKLMNKNKLKQITHNLEAYKEKQISQEFWTQIKNFQRVIQIQFESTMREVFISSLEQCKD